MVLIVYEQRGPVWEVYQQFLYKEPPLSFFTYWCYLFNFKNYNDEFIIMLCFAVKKPGEHLEHFAVDQ